MSKSISPLYVIKDLNRFRHVIAVFMKYGIGDVFHHIRVWEHTNIGKPWFHRPDPKLVHVPFARRLLLAIEDLGPVYIKMGQMLASRPDILPESLCTELEKLEDHVDFIPSEDTRAVIEAELGRPISEVFTWYDEKPLAAASLAQVHRARIGDEEVVLKVQRPNIRKIIDRDLEILRVLAALAAKYSEAIRPYNPAGLVDEFASNVGKELDFLMEANNMKHFAANFAKYEYVHIPKVYDHLCTSRLIVMEFLNGVRIGDRDAIKNCGCDAKQVAIHGVELMLKSVLDDGFFHADPHKGNMLVLPGNVIGLIDFGMMGTLSSRSRGRLIRLVYFVTIGDEARVAKMLLDLSGVESGIDSHDLEEEVARVIQDCRTGTSFDFGPLLYGLIRVSLAHKAPFPLHLLWLTKSVAETESIGERLQVKLNVLDFARPYTRKVILSALNPVKRTRDVYLWMSELTDLAAEFPKDMKTALHLLTTGQTQVISRHVGLEPLIINIRRVTNRIALTLIVCTLLMASAIIVASGIPPLVFGSVPVFGFVAFLVAAGLALVLALSILLEKK